MTTGIFTDMEESVYFGHSALSSTQARQILDSPAKYQYGLTHPRPDKAEFDLGHAVHALVLGRGAPTVVIPEVLLGKGGVASTVGAREFIAEARKKGQTPVKRTVHEQIQAMAKAALKHPMARVLLEQDADSEVSVFGTDPDTGVELRARFDKLPSGGRTPVAADLKTARDASPRGFARAAAEHGYAIQRGHYLDTHRFAGGIDLDGFVFIVVESEAPHLVGVYRLNSDWETLGVDEARRARRIYRECLDTNKWPGYSDSIEALIAPFWVVADAAEAQIA